MPEKQSPQKESGKSRGRQEKTGGSKRNLELQKARKGSRTQELEKG